LKEEPYTQCSSREAHQAGELCILHDRNDDVQTTWIPAVETAETPIKNILNKPEQAKTADSLQRHLARPELGEKEDIGKHKEAISRRFVSVHFHPNYQVEEAISCPNV
jgi:hypothetical protein